MNMRLKLPVHMANELSYGCHIKLSGGYVRMAERAIALYEQEGCSSFQFFAKNPRSLQVKHFIATEAERCRQLMELYRLRSVIHSAYPLNLATSIHDQLEAAIQHIHSLCNDLEIAEATGAIGVVVHFGVVKKSNRLEGYRDILTTLNTVLTMYKGPALILLENQAGLYGGIGSTLEEHVQIKQLCIAPDRVGFCFDTCHAYVSGLWHADDCLGTEQLIRHGEQLGYWDDVEVVHVNDAAEPFGSMRDRHAQLGKGHISLAAMKELLSASQLNGVMNVLETPASDVSLHHAEWEILRQLHYSN
ncbi:deoxyribonuclease IV [Paenibacillus sp. SC116]|uniref:deoxyribonuclease IV n=1 Tax=Paenibacillus sp. SC116 TaxID=2968986 RepID=UPI0028121A28|nr:deoxyribonuclease IV [Paenibacillus sp. SC116]